MKHLDELEQNDKQNEFKRRASWKEKTETLSELRSNLTLQDKKLNVFNEKLFSIIIKGIQKCKEENPTFEPEKS